MGVRPERSVSIFASSESRQVTLWPRNARQTPVVRPTYPVPMMDTFIEFEAYWGHPAASDRVRQGFLEVLNGNRSHRWLPRNPAPPVTTIRLANLSSFEIQSGAPTTSAVRHTPIPHRRRPYQTSTPEVNRRQRTASDFDGP